MALSTRTQSLVDDFGQIFQVFNIALTSAVIRVDPQREQCTSTHLNDILDGFTGLVTGHENKGYPTALEAPFAIAHCP